MKILRIRLKNLNSLRGPQEIDLTEEPLVSAGLFAIVGPTGAGKSTVLDAITLALYGRAARYGSVVSPEDIMSRHCGECMAEVEFEVPSGVYRAAWGLHRARRRVDGDIQPATRYIYNKDSEPIAQGASEVKTKVEELLGLDYDRFLRSVLLAQGDFAKFLKAKPDERAGLLESLTGTEVYSRIGKLAYEQASGRERRLVVKRESIGQIAVLSEEDRLELNEKLEAGDRAMTSLRKEIKAGESMLIFISSLESAMADELASIEELRSIEVDRKNAASNIDQLRLHRLTIPFAADLALVNDAETRSKDAVEHWSRANEEHDRAKRAKNQANQGLRESLKGALARRQGDADDSAKKVKEFDASLNKVREWLQGHMSDAGLVDCVSDLTTAVTSLKSAREFADDKWSDWRREAKEILPEIVQRLPNSLEATQRSGIIVILDDFLEMAIRKRDGLLKDQEMAKKQVRLSQGHLDKARLVAKFEHERSQLKAGDHCPLCGATKHPWVEGAAPSEEIGELEEEVVKATEKFGDAKDHFDAVRRKLEWLTKQRIPLCASIDKRDDSELRLKELFQPIGVAVPVYGQEDVLRAGLQKREEEFRKHRKLQDESISGREKAAEQVKAARKDIEIFDKKLGDLSPLNADIPIEPVGSTALLPVAEAEARYGEAVASEKTTSAQLGDRLETKKAAEKSFETSRTSLQELVAESDLKTLEGLRAARLALDDANNFETLVTNLQVRKTEADALRTKANKKLCELREASVPEGDKAALYREAQETRIVDRDKRVAAQTEYRGSIDSDDENRTQRMTAQKVLDEDQKELVVWNRLKDLIGSADGSKFRRHAQSISLDILTRHANRHLRRLSDRYQICLDDSEALNLQIEDLHQAGARRPMASLSGGESFLASLALALGLSELAGRNVRIDSLFIDEGFGTLDSETLEIAIAALDSLRQNGKTVGVISHVPLLKERIGTQIQIVKQSGGTSIMRVVGG